MLDSFLPGAFDEPDFDFNRPHATVVASDKEIKSRPPSAARRKGGNGCVSSQHPCTFCPGYTFNAGLTCVKCLNCGLPPIPENLRGVRGADGKRKLYQFIDAAKALYGVRK